MKNKEKKSERLNIHITPTDKSIIKDKADAVEMNMSAYVTAAAIVKNITVIGDKKSFDELVTQVRKIGNNINQIRMLAQFGNISFANLDECADALLEINKTLNKAIRKTSLWQP